MLPQSRFFRPSARSTLFLVRGWSAVRVWGLPGRWRNYSAGGDGLLCLCACLLSLEEVDEFGVEQFVRNKVHVEIGKKEVVQIMEPPFGKHFMGNYSFWSFRLPTYRMAFLIFHGVHGDVILLRCCKFHD